MVYACPCMRASTNSSRTCLHTYAHACAPVRAQALESDLALMCGTWRASRAAIADGQLRILDGPSQTTEVRLSRICQNYVGHNNQ